MTDAELAALAIGAQSLAVYPPEHVLYARASNPITVGNYPVAGRIFCRCPDGQDRWLTHAEYGRVVHFTTDAKARTAAMTPKPAKAPALPRAEVTKTQLEQLGQRVDALAKATAERKAHAQAEASLRPYRQQAAWQAAWQADPRATAIRGLQALGIKNPTEDQISHARACAGHP